MEPESGLTRSRLLVVAVFGAAVATVTVNVSLTSSLLTRGLGAGVGRLFPPAFGLPEHWVAELSERDLFAMSDGKSVRQAKCDMRNKPTNSFKLSLKL